ncbi:hypothetical protein [uncultured Algimonas sp.]|uniref:hypothetical protein n=1 Tax=uncultured Algimonas sp. TaxID=1547920 RepID=UPI002637C974|nr:hypothetical protein [uncultured Algimonas sp.]
MFASPLSLQRTLLAGLCASALVMGSCRGGDKPAAEEITVDAATLELTKADEGALSRHFEVEARDGTESETLALLDALGMDGASYGERAIDGSTVVYTDWTASSGNAAIQADRVEMIGLHETDDGATLDKLVVLDMGLKAYEEDESEARVEVVDAAVANLTVVQPTADLMADLTDVLMARDTAAEKATDTVEDIADTGEFRAIRLADMTATVREDEQTGTFAIEQIVVGNDADMAIMDVVLETLNFEWAADDDSASDTDAATVAKPFKLEMDGLTAMGLDTTQMDPGNMPGAGLGASFMNGFMSGLSPRGTPPFRQIDLGRVALESGTFDLITDGFEADTTVDGGVTTLRSVMEPMIVTFKDMTDTPVAPYMDVLRENGLAEISMKGSGTTIFDPAEDRVRYEDGLFDIDDGLRMRCDYSVLGTNAAAASMKASGVTMPVFDFSDDGDSEAEMERYMAEMERYNAAQAEANKLIRIESLDCDIQDVPGNSLVERGYKVASAITGRPVPVLKGSAKTMIALGSLTAPSAFQRDLMDTVGSGLIDFIDTPGQTMTITMAPEEPVSITSLTGQDGSEPTIEPLNLSVEVQ